jgi:transcriptional regulator with XRE-family HTH domain
VIYGMGIGERLSALRNKTPWTQDDVAKRLGIARTTYAMYEQGRREPDAGTLSKLAELYDVTVDYLLCRTNEPHGYSSSEAFMHVSPDERKLIDVVRELPADKQQQVAEFADFLKSKVDQSEQETATIERDGIASDITEIAAHMESEYGINDPEFVEHIHNVIRRAQRKYDAMIQKQRNNG